MNRQLPLVLVAGGLFEPRGPERFWHDPGVAGALSRLGYEVHTPQRPAGCTSWAGEADALRAAVEAVGRPVGLVAASNGCSAALRAALAVPALVDRLVLCWPATGDDAEIDAAVRRSLGERGVPDASLDILLDGEAVRGVHPTELRGLACPTTLVPAEPEDPFHQTRTVAWLRHQLPRVAIGLGTPPSPTPAFAGHLGAFVGLLDVVLTDS
jgi:hypothetical protein